MASRDDDEVEPRDHRRGLQTPSGRALVVRVMHRLPELPRRAYAGRSADSGEDDVEAAVREGAPA